MRKEPKLKPDTLVLSLSDSLALIHPSAADRRQRSSCITPRMAKSLGYASRSQADLMYASVLHDIGLLPMEGQRNSLHGNPPGWNHMNLNAAAISKNN